MEISAVINCNATLGAELRRADGTHRVIELKPRTLMVEIRERKLLRYLYDSLKCKGLIPAFMTFAAFCVMMHMSGQDPNVLVGLVTTAGINILAGDFNAGASSHINTFKYHDSGTGTTAAAIGDTALQTQAGPSTRATGTQDTATTGHYKSSGTINYTGTLAITEWGLFNQAAQGGTLWDHRIFSAVNVANGDAITFNYDLTCNAGGS